MFWSSPRRVMPQVGEGRLEPGTGRITNTRSILLEPRHKCCWQIKVGPPVSSAMVGRLVEATPRIPVAARRVKVQRPTFVFPSKRPAHLPGPLPSYMLGVVPADSPGQFLTSKESFTCYRKGRAKHALNGPPTPPRRALVSHFASPRPWTSASVPFF